MIIQYKVVQCYGNRREYVIDTSKAHVISELTGQKTIDERIRYLITALSDGEIKFEQVQTNAEKFAQTVTQRN